MLRELAAEALLVLLLTTFLFSASRHSGSAGTPREHSRARQQALNPNLRQIRPTTPAPKKRGRTTRQPQGRPAAGAPMADCWMRSYFSLAIRRRHPSWNILARTAGEWGRHAHEASDSPAPLPQGEGRDVTGTSKCRTSPAAWSWGGFMRWLP